MSADNSDKTRGMFANPLPIVMVVLLAAGVLVKNVPLESARPIDPERVKFMPTTQQDVEARLWQDPFAAIEKHVERSAQAIEVAHTLKASASKAHTTEALHERIKELRHLAPNHLTVVAVSVFGGSFVEAAEYRRRSRFAVVSALGFHHYHPENADAIGYFNINLPEPGNRPLQLTVPYEWYERKDPSSNVLVLWLNEEKFTTAPLVKLHALFKGLTPPPTTLPANSSDGLNVKLVGPAGSAMLTQLVPNSGLPTTGNVTKKNSMMLKSDVMLQMFSPSATVSNCELSLVSGGRDDSKKKLWECIKIKDFPRSNDLTLPQIVRTIGTDDTLSAALLWELWQRGVNREFGYDDSWWQMKWTHLVNNKKYASSPRNCKDGLVLISEWDSKYARTLSRNLTDGFSSLCGTDPSVLKQVRTFNYLRGLDGVLPDIDKSGTNASHKDDGGKSKDPGAQLRDIPIEHAEGRSQYDYLRRLADEITQLNSDKQFAENGIKAIGIVGSDVYDKLLILQSLRNRFKDKIFFTTDLDARYLHADQKDWARNLVVASNFGLSLRPELQQSTLPFRDSYQTATYLATLMALENKVFDWTGKMKQWLRPQIFEIGRTEAVHLASPTVDDLTVWYDASRIEGSNLKGAISPKIYKPCDHNYWAECTDIEPARPLLRPSFEHAPEIFLMVALGLLLIAMASRHVHETLRAAKNTLSSPVNAKAAKFWLTGVGLVALVALYIFAYIVGEMNASLKQGIGEPFVWLEGTSVWPSLVLRLIGFVLMLVLTIAGWSWIWREARLISRDFNFSLPQTWTLARSRWSAVWTGPYVDLTSFNTEGKADPKSVGPEIEIATLWQSYLRATGMREMKGWIVLSTVIIVLLGYAAFQVFGMPLFPHRGQLVERLNLILVFLNASVLWLVIFWVSYQTRACAQFIKMLSNMSSVWPERLLNRKEAETGVPRAYLADYLDFQLVMRATQRIHWLIYLPFVLIFFMVIARSDLFDAMNFPLVLVFVIGLVLVYALFSEVLLHRGAFAARTKVLDYYEMLLWRMQSPPPLNNNLNVNPEDGSRSPDMANGAVAGPAQLKDSPTLTVANNMLLDSIGPPINAEQIKLLMERIRNTREGVFAPVTEQSALRALLLPFGGFGGAQLIEYLMNFMV